MISFPKTGASKGFTLIELLLYAVIFSILVISLFQIFTSIIDTQIESQSSSSVFVDGQYILNRFRYDMHQAESIPSPSSSGGVSTSAQLSTDNLIYTYSLNGGNMILTNSVTSTSARLNSINTSVSNLNFVRISDLKGKNMNTLTISFTLTSNLVKRGEKKTENFKTSMGIRPK